MRWLAVVVALVLTGCFRNDVPSRGGLPPVDRRPRIRPQLHGATIPPNIAPLSFVVLEPGVEFVLELSAPGGERVVVRRGSPDTRIPMKLWRQVLAAAEGGDLTLVLRVRSDIGSWQSFEPMVLHVASAPVDPVLAYRQIKPLYNLWADVRIRQRDLATWDSWTILDGNDYGEGCTNCHTFQNQEPDVMTIGVRSRDYGSCTLLVRDGKATKLKTKWGYASWHPTQPVAAYSLNKVRQFFHSLGDEVRDVVDLDSDLAVYLADEERVVTAAAIADPERLETYPCWSADGRALFYCSALFPWTKRDRMPPDNYREARYSLARATYDPSTRTFGEMEILIDAESVGKSILLPRTSPDGRFLMFCMTDYGCFPIYQPSSDLYLMDLASGEYRRLDLNSARSESWHSWSSNSRWFAFSSKRRDGVFTRIYMAHVDADGTIGQPFILPQEDPAYYDGCLDTFTVPEFVRRRAPVRSRRLAAAVKGTAGVDMTLPPMSMTGGAGTADTTHPWQPAGTRRTQSGRE